MSWKSAISLISDNFQQFIFYLKKKKIFLWVCHIEINILIEDYSDSQKIIICMSTKESQLYLYFQNKAHHYQNIQTARHKIADRLDSSMNETIDYLSRQRCNRDQPANKRYQISIQNEHMNDRLASIQLTSRKEVDVDGNYARYNSFERKFRLRNRAKAEQERLIRIKNQKIQAKIASMKPQIGSHSFWEADYKQKTRMVRKINPSKGSLMLEQKPFFAEAYQEFLNQINFNQKQKSDKDMKSSRSSKGQERYIPIEKLFVLPNLTAKKSPELKNSQVTVINPENILQKTEQNKQSK